jgi:predicted transcriptional regulator
MYIHEKGSVMTTMTIRINEADKRLIQSYASIHGLSAADVLRRSALEKIEDEFDLKELEEAMRTSTGEFVTHEKLMKKYGFA